MASVGGALYKAPMDKTAKMNLVNQLIGKPTEAQAKPPIHFLYNPEEKVKFGPTAPKRINPTANGGFVEVKAKCHNVLHRHGFTEEGQNKRIKEHLIKKKDEYEHKPKRIFLDSVNLINP